MGFGALFANSSGQENTAIGNAALANNPPGNFNTANGAFALYDNNTGTENTATGRQALAFSKRSYNTANGANALGQQTDAAFNTAVGHEAGFALITGRNNVYIGAGMVGVADESDACYIKSIFGQTSASGVPVLINSNNKLGTITSSKRFKEDIRPMDNASEALFALKPVTFRYKKEIDPAGIIAVRPRGRGCGKSES